MDLKHRITVVVLITIFCPVVLSALGQNRRVNGPCRHNDISFSCLDDNTHCVITNSNDTGICQCLDKHFLTTENQCEPVPGTTNYDCESGYFCDSINDTCQIGRCKTMPGKRCTSNRQCVSEAVCPQQTGQCTCVVPYLPGTRDCRVPAKLVSGSCNPMQDSPCDDVNARCLGNQNYGTCVCREPLATSAMLTCEAKPKGLDGLCDVNDTRPCDDVNAVCSRVDQTSRCVCGTGFARTVHSTCLSASAVGKTKGPCAWPSTCESSNDVCSQNTCRLKAGVRNCSQEADKCVSESSCVNDVCTCWSHYANINGRCYRIQRTLGGTCNPAEGDDACDDVTAQCQTGAEGVGVCLCKNNQEATMWGTCAASSLTAASSLLLLLLAILLSMQQ